MNLAIIIAIGIGALIVIYLLVGLGVVWALGAFEDGLVFNKRTLKAILQWPFYYLFLRG